MARLTTHIIEVVWLAVTLEHNKSLNSPFSREEGALNQMFLTNSPGVDGMRALFYHNYWDIVGYDVVSFYLNGRASVKEVNHTLLTLIPKVHRPAKVSFDQSVYAQCYIKL